ncbi:GNAT family N-acetyltransferase [Bacillus suaedae]|uniref:N-acetyltransferase n=1 Tax=Halalkalibacter suaedae TaxID=2822140 RepID=A0A940WVF7_9BACI|nr:GNAT family N-acetyltransferase [Bacillus suaedae]MBP3951048.1 N-acetyltransferase [Bacillus suaedae]
MNVVITNMKDSDRDQVLDIYMEGISTGNATFQTEPMTWEEWNGKYANECRFVAREEDRVVGWIAILPYSTRFVYAGVAEVSIYISLAHTGLGIGARLLSKLIEESEKKGYWTLQAGIYPENEASMSLHKKAGFREVGKRERIGKLNGIWRDVILLERRSKIVGLT